MNLGVIAILCVFDVIFAVAVICWNITNKNRCKDDTTNVIESSKEKDYSKEENKKEEVIEKPVRIKQPKEKKTETIATEEIVEPVKEIIEEQQPIEEPKTLEEQQPIEELKIVEEQQPIEEPKVEEKIEEVEEKKEEPIAKTVDDKEVKEEIIEQDVQEDATKEEIVRLTFAEKLLSLQENVQEYYNQICNFFYSYRQVNRRVSNGYVSFRNGRVLIAKLSIRGKTMKLHLALPLNGYDEGLYFQKDYSGVKQYAEVPFTVKVKSDRGLKRALELIGALAIEKEIQEKARFTPIDALAEIKEKLDK